MEITNRLDWLELQVIKPTGYHFVHVRTQLKSVVGSAILASVEFQLIGRHLIRNAFSLYAHGNLLLVDDFWANLVFRYNFVYFEIQLKLSILQMSIFRYNFVCLS